MSGAAYFLIFDGFADWEPAHALAELRRSGNLPVQSVGFTREPVVSMGGLRVVPDCSLDDVDPADVRIFILPGGDMWEAVYPRSAIERLLHGLAERGVPIAAICGATLAVARAGLLRGRRHTSNGVEYLSGSVEGYDASASYVDTLAVRDRGLITASGLGAVDFAAEIFAELGVFSDSDRALWFDMFKHGRMPTSLDTASAPG